MKKENKTLSDEIAVMKYSENWIYTSHVKFHLKKLKKMLKEKLKLYEMKIIVNGKSMILRGHEKREFIDKAFKKHLGKEFE